MLDLGFGLSQVAISGRGGGPTAHGTWAPTDLGTALAAWWNADDTADGAPASWTDRNSGVVATAAGGPVSDEDSFNASKRGISFDGVDDMMTNTAFTALPTGATAGFILSALQVVTTGAQGFFFSYGATTVGQRRSLGKVATDKPIVSDGNLALTSADAHTNSYIILAGAWSGTTEEGWLNGSALPGSPGTTVQLATATTRLRIGAYLTSTATSFTPMVIRHIFVLTGLPSAADRQRLEGWVAHDCGLTALLPSGHPYKTWMP